MDFETQRRKRLEALEEKKKRLEEMKKLNRERETSTMPPKPDSVASTRDRDDVDDLVNSLLQSSVNNPPSNIELTDTEKKQVTEPEIITSNDRKIELATYKSKKLTIEKNLLSFELLPKQLECYDKSIQTDSVETSTNDDDNMKYDSIMSPHKLAHRRLGRNESVSVNNSQASGSNTSVNNNIITNLNNTLFNTAITNTTTNKPKKLSDEDIKYVLSLPEFYSFLHDTSNVIERAITQTSSYDILTNYACDKLSTTSTQLKKSMIQLYIYEDDITKSRPIMDIQFSPHFPELFLVAYGSKTQTSNTMKRQGMSNSNTSSSSSTYHPSPLTLSSPPNTSTTTTTTTNLSGTTTAISSHYNNLAHEDSLGLVCIWSTLIPHKPEYKFYASSPVLTARFHEIEEHIIYGGCYTGQILQWDIRAKSMPVQRSSLTGNSHKHPVYAMSFAPRIVNPNVSNTSGFTATTSTVGVSGGGGVGGGGASTMMSAELITISIDGMMCYWDINRLIEPINIIQLQSMCPPILTNLPTFSTDISSSTGMDILSSGINTKGNTLPLNITSMTFNAYIQDKQHTCELLVGSGTGQLFKSHLPPRNNTTLSHIDAHSGMITSMNIHPNTQKQFQSLLLTSSLDWSIKLWNISSWHSTPSTNSLPSTSTTTNPNTTTKVKPLYEFLSTSYDYISDVTWCPVHPGIFVTLSSSGMVTLWNLVKSTSEPVDVYSLFTSSSTSNIDDKTSTTINSGHTSNPSASISGVAGNKLKWSSNGKILLVGDSKGTTHILQIRENILTYTTTDENKLEYILSHNTHHTTTTSATTNTNTTGVNKTNTDISTVPISE